jgi:Protein of unknown function (DUF3300)
VRQVPGLSGCSLSRRFIALIVAFSFLIMEQADVAQTPAPAAAPAAPVDTSPATLDHLLAPIALYPDPLLMQVLAASVNEQEVLDGGNWLLENKSLEGAALDAAAQKAGFGAAMQALFHFPDVVDLMCTQIDWTTQLGDAFNADQAGVLASVQRLRAQAKQYGTLKSSPQQTVTTQTDNGKQVIIIQPANPQVVYVPQYNPQTVYVQQSSGPSTGDVVAASIISFGVGIAIGAMFSSNNYYYPRWGYGGVYYRGGPWYPAHYVYRPVYGPVFRPAYGYRPPPGYPYHRPVHYPSYYNGYRPGGPAYRPPTNRPGGGYNRPPSNGGGYNRPPANGGGYNRPGTLPSNPGNNRPPGNGYNKPPTGGTTRPGTPPANGGGYNRPGNPGNGGGNGAVTRPTTRPAVTPDRGYSKPATQPATRPAPQQRPATPQQRPAPQQQRPAQQSRPAPAFSGGNGKSTQAASQRGAASRGGRGHQ